MCFFVPQDSYEKFRTVLTMNLANVLPADQLAAALQAVDLSMDDFEITRKRMELITSAGVPQVVKEYLATKHIAQRSTGTLKQYRFRLEHFFSIVQKSYMDITAKDIRLYLYHMETVHHAGPAYRDTARLILSGFFKWLVENDYLAKSPCVKVERIKFTPKHRDPLTPIQLEQLRWSASDAREKAIIDFFYSTGMRVSECAAVRLSDIDWSARSVRIWHGKGDKERTVYFNAEAEVSLRMYLASRQDDTEALFVSCKGNHAPLQVGGLQTVIRKAGRRSGVKVHPHKLRNTFATAGLRGGIPLHQLQVLMGHVKPETTLIYAKQYQEDIRREHERIYA